MQVSDKVVGTLFGVISFLGRISWACRLANLAKIMCNFCKKELCFASLLISYKKYLRNCTIAPIFECQNAKIFLPNQQFSSPETGVLLDVYNINKCLPTN